MAERSIVRGRLVGRLSTAASAARSTVGVGGSFDQIDALFFEGDQQVIELLGIDFFVGQIVVDLVVGQIALGLALGDQFLQILVRMVHLSIPPCALRVPIWT